MQYRVDTNTFSLNLLGPPYETRRFHGVPDQNELDARGPINTSHHRIRIPPMDGVLVLDTSLFLLKTMVAYDPPCFGECECATYCMFGSTTRLCPPPRPRSRARMCRPCTCPTQGARSTRASIAAPGSLTIAASTACPTVMERRGASHTNLCGAAARH